MIIDSINNKRVKRWKKLLNKKEQRKLRQFIVEGVHLVEEALRAGVVSEIIIGGDTNLPETFGQIKAEVFQVDEKIIRLLSTTKTSQKIFAVCTERNCPKNFSTANKVLLLDAVQDPGNLGTIIRTASAAGIDLLVCGLDCVTLHNPKTIRASQGSIFYLPIIYADIAKTILKLKELGTLIYGSTPTCATSIFKVEKAEKFALLVGNEGNGIKTTLLNMCDKKVSIPIYGNAESLNVSVATGIMVYSLLNKENQT